MYAFSCVFQMSTFFYCRDHLLFLLLNASELMKTKSNLDEELQTAELPIDMKQVLYHPAFIDPYSQFLLS